MTVVEFSPRRGPDVDSWSSTELQQLMEFFTAHAAKGGASAWDVDATEYKDPQFYLIGPAPDQGCVLCISRIGSTYLLEDGDGNVLAESRCLRNVTDAATVLAVRPCGRSLVLRLVCAWVAIRELIEEKIEPAVAHPAELLGHVAPQLAAFA